MFRNGKILVQIVICTCILLLILVMNFRSLVDMTYHPSRLIENNFLRITSNHSNEDSPSFVVAAAVGRKTEKDQHNGSPSLQQNYTKVGLNLLYSDTTTLMSHTKPDYLPNYTNPCFLVSQNKDGYYFLSGMTNQSKHAVFTFTLCFPSVYLAGIRKCGTTDFSLTLMQHRGIQRGTKEFNFWNAGRSQLPYSVLHYLVNLKTAAVHTGAGRGRTFTNSQVSDTKQPNYGKHRLLGDYTPGNAIHKTIPHKIHHLVPDAKIISIVRDPVSRASSGYRFDISFMSLCKEFHCENSTWMAITFHKRIKRAILQWGLCVKFYKGDEKVCFYNYQKKKFLQNERKQIQFKHRDSMYLSCLSLGLYHVLLSEYFAVFPNKSILIVDMEEYSNNRLKIMNENVLPFLGLPPFNQQEAKFNKRKQINASKVKFDMLPETVKMLQEFYAPYQKKLAELRGRHLKTIHKL